MNIYKAKITIHGFYSLDEDDRDFLKYSLGQLLQIETHNIKPQRNFKYLGEQCCVMSWLVDDTFIIELDFNDCLE